MGRPRAADDFPAIRARLEELQRERSGQPAPDDRHAPDRLRPNAAGGDGIPSRSSGMGTVAGYAPSSAAGADHIAATGAASAVFRQNAHYQLFRHPAAVWP